MMALSSCLAVPTHRYSCPEERQGYQYFNQQSKELSENCFIVLGVIDRDQFPHLLREATPQAEYPISRAMA
jgi:hypothetical protein